jgi:hypothetical protein
MTTPLPLLRKEGFKVLGAFCPGKWRFSSAYCVITFKVPKKLKRVTRYKPEDEADPADAGMSKRGG